jgi:hypothetical protein
MREANVGRARKRTQALVHTAVLVMLVSPALADEGGVSFWLPGTFGSLAATPPITRLFTGQHLLATSVSAGRDVALSRQEAMIARAVIDAYEAGDRGLQSLAAKGVLAAADPANLPS